MYCSKCGKMMSEDDKFCPSCGSKVAASEEAEKLDASDASSEVDAEHAGLDSTSLEADPEYDAEPESDSEPDSDSDSDPEPEQPASAPSNKRRMIIMIVALVVSLIAVGSTIAYCVWYSHEQHVKQTPVQFTVNAAGYDDNADSKIPLVVTGTDNDGTQVNQTIYINSTGEGLNLRIGTYTVTVPASPLTARGVLYRNDDVKVTVTIGEDGLVGDASSRVVELPLIDGKDMTADRIAAAEKYARESGMDAGTVDNLVKGTNTYMEEHKLVTFSYRLESVGGFTYAQFACDDASNPHVDEINGTLESIATQAYGEKAPANENDADFTKEYRTSYASKVTYFDRGYAQVVTESYKTSFGAHGWMARETYLYNIMTGEEASPAELVGLSDDAANSLTYSAVDTYFATGHGDIFKSAADAFKNSSVAKYVSSGSIRYFVGPDGLYVWFGSYTLGSYASGMKVFRLTDMDGNAVFAGEPIITEPNLPDEGQVTFEKGQLAR